jgi:HD-like signal output (HDOD) protein/CheY-like chemotaxis protein
MIDSNRQILYVAEPLRDARFESELVAVNPSWNISVTESATQAIAQLRRKKFDALITHDQLADMDGFRLLDLVQAQHPQMHRFIVADLSNAKAAVKSTGTAHQCIPRPIDPAVLRNILERVFNLNIWLSNPAVRNLLGRMKRIPSPPDLYLAIVRVLRDPDADLEEVSTRAAQDPAITARLLQLANSAALGLRHKVVNVGEAIGYLGLEMTRSLVLLAHAFNYCDTTKKPNQRFDRLWKHSLQTGTFARRIAREEGALPGTLDESFLAGLLHDLGELLLMVNLPQDYSTILNKAAELNQPLWQVELDHFGATHAELGAHLMAIWNLPLSVVEALALHHHPTRLLSSGFGPLTAVHVADVIDQELAASNEPGNQIDLHYLSDLGLSDRLDHWREACRDEFHREVS